MNIGKRINEILEEKQMTKTELIKKSKVAKTQIYNLCNGTNTNVTIDTLTAISESLEIDITELFKDKNNIGIFLNSVGKEMEKMPEDTQKKVKNLIWTTVTTFK